MTDYTFRRGTKVRTENGTVGKVVNYLFKTARDPKTKSDTTNEWVIVQHEGDPDYRLHGYLAVSLEKASTK